MLLKFFLPFLCLLILVLFFCPCKTVLSISERKNPNNLILSSQAYKNGFSINYTHSVNKGRVHDYYYAGKNDELILDRTIFVSYGAGIPEASETKDAFFEISPDGYQIKNLNRRMKRLLMAVGVIAEHSISFIQNGKETEYFLKEYFEPRTSLIFEIKRVSLFKLYKSRRFDGNS